MHYFFIKFFQATQQKRTRMHDPGERENDEGGK